MTRKRTRDLTGLLLPGDLVVLGQMRAATRAWLTPGALVAYLDVKVTGPWTTQKREHPSKWLYSTDGPACVICIVPSVFSHVVDERVDLVQLLFPTGVFWSYWLTNCEDRWQLVARRTGP